MTSTGNLRFLRHGDARQEQPAVLDSAGSSFSLLPLTADIDGDFLNAGGIPRTRRALADGALPAAQLDGRIGPPIARPGKIVCVGLNYGDHARETGQEPPAEPVVFMKASNTVVGPTTMS